MCDSPTFFFVLVAGAVILVVAIWAVVAGAIDAIKEQRSVGVLTALVGLIVACFIIWMVLAGFDILNSLNEARSAFGGEPATIFDACN